MKIFLLGFMGAGKSTIAAALAQKLGKEWMDLDHHIEAAAGRSISQIFAEKGEATFRQMETEHLRQTLQHPALIVATGGGTPCQPANLQWMNENGVTIYLQVPPKELARRLAPEKAHRPLISHLSEAELPAFLEKLLAQRRPFYEGAHFSCRADLPTEEVVAGIAHYFQRFSY